MGSGELTIGAAFLTLLGKLANSTSQETLSEKQKTVTLRSKEEVLGLYCSLLAIKSRHYPTLFHQSLTLEQKHKIVGVSVEIKQIINVMKEILDNCHGLTLANVMVMPHSDDTAVEGEEIYIMKNVTEPTRQCLEDVIKKHNLAVRYEADKIVIYEPAT